MVGAAVSPTRRAWATWGRVGLSAAIIAVLLHKAKPGRVVHIVQSSTLGYLVLGIVVSGIGLVLSAWRWQRVLVALERPVAFGRLVAHSFAGQFVGNFLPTSIGGDVLRVVRLAADTGSSETSFASVVLERLTGWVVLPVLALVGLAVSPRVRHLDTPSHLTLLIALATLALLGGVLVLAGHPRLAGRFAERQSWSRFIGAVHFGVDRLRRHPSAVVGVLGAAFVYQLATVLTFALAIRVAGLHVPFGAVLAFAPIVAIVQVVSPLQGGFGFREGALYLFLHALVRADGKDASAVGLLFAGMIIVVSLLGAPAFVRNRAAVPVS